MALFEKFSPFSICIQTYPHSGVSEKICLARAAVCKLPPLLYGCTTSEGQSSPICMPVVNNDKVFIKEQLEYFREKKDLALT